MGTDMCVSSYRLYVVVCKIPVTHVTSPRFTYCKAPYVAAVRPNIYVELRVVYACLLYCQTISDRIVHVYSVNVNVIPMSALSSRRVTNKRYYHYY